MPHAQYALGVSKGNTGQGFGGTTDGNGKTGPTSTSPGYVVKGAVVQLACDRSTGDRIVYSQVIP